MNREQKSWSTPLSRFPIIPKDLGAIEAYDVPEHGINCFKGNTNV